LELEDGTLCGIYLGGTCQAGECIVEFCSLNQHVVDNQCVACPAGYTNPAGDNPELSDTSCTDINECDAGTDDCSVDATYSNTAGSYNCTCNDGYEGNGISCTDIDECADGMANCDPNAACSNIAGGFSCACNDGYSGDGTSCTEIDECAAGTDNCSDNATCSNTVGGFDCACGPGYEGDGTICTDIDECVIENVCNDGNAFCTNEAGGFSCSCNAGFAIVNGVCTAQLCSVNQHVVSNTCVACPAGTTNAAGDNSSGNDTTCDVPPPPTLTGTLRHYRIEPSYNGATDLLSLSEFNTGAFVADDGFQVLLADGSCGNFGVGDDFHEKPCFDQSISLTGENLVAGVGYTVTYLGFSVITNGVPVCSDEACAGPAPSLRISMNPIHDVNATATQEGYDKFERFPHWGIDGGRCDARNVQDTRDWIWNAVEFISDCNNFCEPPPYPELCLVRNDFSHNSAGLPFGRWFNVPDPVSNEDCWKWGAYSANVGNFADDDGAAFFSQQQAPDLDFPRSKTVVDILDAAELSPGLNYLCNAYYEPRAPGYFVAGAGSTDVTVQGLFVRGRLPAGHSYRLRFRIEGGLGHPLQSEQTFDTTEVSWADVQALLGTTP
jgi:hypothetical protein